MKEKPAKNRQRKLIFIVILFILAVLCMFFVNYFVTKYHLEGATSVGIIGGADGPTAIYLGKNNENQS